MENQKVSLEQATKEVDAWLVSRKTNDKKIASMKEAGNYETLVEDVMSGKVVFEGDGEKLVQLLEFPILGETKIDRIIYKGRLKQGDIEPWLSKVKATDGFGILKAYVSAASGEGSAILNKLDQDDYKTSQNIAGFFI